MTRLHELYRDQRQSPWLDDLKRSYLQDGTLAKRVDEGIRGVTSNPTIFAKAIAGEQTYDDEFAALAKQGSVTDAYWRLVMDDVSQACGLLRATYDEAVGADGFVSLEVAPDLAHDTEGTVKAARWIHGTVDKPNLMVKIPATEAGIPAIRTMIADGRNINVTLIFSLSRYAEVIEAYLSGLEDLVGRGGDPSNVASVASFFVRTPPEALTPMSLPTTRRRAPGRPTRCSVRSRRRHGSRTVAPIACLFLRGEHAG